MYRETAGNIQLARQENIHLEKERESGAKRRYVRRSEVEKLAVEKYQENGLGITYNDLVAKGIAGNKREAQLKLKNCLRLKIIFVYENHKPQRYFPNCKKAHILERLKKSYSRNIPSHPSYPNQESTAAERGKLNSFYEVLVALSGDQVPLSIHRMQLQTTVRSEIYDKLIRDSEAGNKAKVHYERIGGARITYLVYPNGKVMICIACSSSPFNLFTDLDESVLFSFLGQVRDRLLRLLGDTQERIVPPIALWQLTGCDVNKDIEISDRMQLDSINIQLKNADKVFRAYIKEMEGKSVYRAEESISYKVASKDSSLPHALKNIRGDPELVQKRFDQLEEKVNRLISALP